MNPPKIEIPVPVLKHPFWRINIRPEKYIQESVPTLDDCFRIIQKNRVRLRGWDYPHLSSKETEKECGINWIASWSNFLGHCEYWRFYQSKQFIHFFGIRESIDEEWDKKLEAQTRMHLGFNKNIDWDNIPGFISIINFIYCVTEIVEFATRLCQAGIYKGFVDINIQLNSIKGFVLTTSNERAWHSYYAANQDILGKTWSTNSKALISDSPKCASEIVIWFFERFGWLNPSVEIIRKDIDDFLKGNI